MDSAHVQHELAHAWFAREGRAAWASCPLTQNGVLRIIGHRQYPGFSGGPAAVAPLLHGLIQLPGHQFWPDDVSLLDGSRVDPSRLMSAARVTDTYLLALAAAHQGQLATLDARLSSAGVHGGVAALYCIAPAS